MMVQDERHLDRPIRSGKLDKLDRGRFVGRLAQALVSEKRATGVRIGLTGEWGSGKTSILHMLEERIKKEHSGSWSVSIPG